MLEPIAPDSEAPGSLIKRLAWFFGIALMSLLVVACVAYVLRGLLFLG